MLLSLLFWSSGIFPFVFFFFFIHFLKALVKTICLSKEVNIPALLSVRHQMSIRPVVAAVVQDVFRRRAKQLEILPLAAATNLAII